MLRVIALVLASVMGYALLNVIVENKLSRVTPFAIAFFYLFITSVIAGVILLALVWANGLESIIWPTGPQWKYVFLCPIFLLLADYCLFGAYYYRGDLVLVSTVLATFPLWAVLIRWLLKWGSLPNGLQVVGIVLGILAVVFVSLGTRQQETLSSSVPESLHEPSSVLID